jgi:inner membrane protein
MKTFMEIIRKLSSSISLKVGVIGFMILILLIPANLIMELIRERQNTRDEVVREISDKWGDIQVLSGPVMVIPFYEYQEYAKETIKINRKLYVLPESLNVDGEINPEIRYRGIYKVIVYKSNLDFEGKFLLPDFEKTGIDQENIDWQNITVVMGLTDMRGIQNDIKILWQGEAVSVDPGVESKIIAHSGFTAKVPVSKSISSMDFKLNIDLNGSYGMYFAPVGKTTNVKLVSEWTTPSFSGSFLPDSRKVSADGFEAEWTVLHLNRNYPQQWIDDAYTLSGSSTQTDWEYLAGQSNRTFGVNLLFAVDEYQMSMRSAKYAVMFISLTFLIFLFVEILNKKRIHPVQYLLVSFGLLLFYTLLLSLSEHLGFDLAYLISGMAIIGLISMYSYSMLCSSKLTLITSIALMILYAFLFVILQLEDYSLLMGSVGLFLILALVMFLSKRINWYGHLDERE